ncbi:MAG: hydrogenase subunit MbhD domain-containing protein [Thermoplasmatota archaeon]
MQEELIVQAIHVIVPIFIVAASVVAILLKDLVAAVIALAAMSLLLSLEFYILNAPDVAIAEAGVGACLTTAIFIIAIKATKRKEDEL